MTFIAWILKRRAILLISSISLILFLAIPLPRFPEDYSTVILDADGEILNVFLNKNQQWCLPPDPGLEIPDKLKTAVLEVEDRYFRWHPGVNLVSLVRALAENARAGEVKSGASTITMQVARLSKPKARTVPNKILEMLQAFKLEALHSKNGILRMYLDHAPYGGNVAGLRAAALRYFGKMPGRLSWAEAATLAVLPNNPGLIAPGMRTDLLKNKRDALLRKLCARNRIPQGILELALLEPVPSTSRPFPSAARHLARMLEADPNRNRPTVRTTIEKALQVRIERLVADHAATRLRPLGIRNAAAIVAETATGKVRAYVGSQDFFDMENGGQVDGVAALRSPGSLLKPFLYALAMDRGILLPQTKIKDVPTFYGAFSPANANASYDGLVTMKDALVRSLNVPAVRVLYTVGVRPFYLFLAAAGIRSLFRAPEDYGLPLILGGAEVSMWDIAVLFRGLGNAGRFRPLNVVESEAKIDDGAGRPCLISPGACWLTLSVLRELRRPDAETYWELYQNQWPIAWKTGTSYGFRDAWAAGVSPLWTIVVWAGNFNGEGNASLSGAPCAGTLLFAIHNALPKTRGRNWFDPPVEDLDPATLCLETGFLAGAHCPDTQAAEAPRKMKPLMLCPYHRHVFLSKDGTTEVCSACWSPGEVREADRLSFPPEVAQFLRESGKAAKEAPPHNPRCPAYGAEGALALLYPQEGARLWIPRDLDGKLEKVTLRAVHRDRGVLVHWYLDDRYLGATRGRHVKSCLMRKGGHTLHVVDEYGNRASVGFTADLRGNVE